MNMAQKWTGRRDKFFKKKGCFNCHLMSLNVMCLLLACVLFKAYFFFSLVIGLLIMTNAVALSPSPWGQLLIYI